MKLVGFIHAIAAAGIFPSRAFIPAFTTVLLLKFGPGIPIINDWGFFRELTTAEGAPSWFTHDATLIVLGILSLIELLAQKNQDLRQLLNDIDQYAKPVLAALIAYGLLGASEAEVITTIREAGLAEGIFPLFVAGAVYVAAGLRRSVLAFVSDMDPGDNLGLQGLISWMEDAWSVFGIFLLFIFPILMLILTGLILLVLFLVQKAIEKRDRKTRIPCAGCGEAIYPSGRTCFSCGRPVETPCAIGFFGQPKPGKPADPHDRPFRLVEKRRCPNCASSLRKPTPAQICDACEFDLMTDPGFWPAYKKRLDRRLPKILAVCAGFSFLPLLGLIPGIILYRLQLVMPIRYYTPTGYSILARWAARLLCFILLMFQWVPVLGGAALPLMALINYGVYRKAFTKNLSEITPPQIKPGQSVNDKLK